MGRFNANIGVMEMDSDPAGILKDVMREIVYGGIVAFANAAAGAVPIRTGLTRGIWLGVAEYYQPLSKYAPPITIDVSDAKPWYMPHWPVAKPNYNAIVYGSDNGVEEGKKLQAEAVTVTESDKGFEITINLPESNYAYSEDTWRSIQAGRSAMQTYIRETIKELDLTRKALRKRLITRKYRNG